MIERWKDIPGYPYQVSSLGRVRRLGGKVLTPRPQTSGYLRVQLCRDGGGKDFYIHRLVCRAFHGRPPTGDAHADHLNRIRTDNKSENLQWATPSQNRATRVFQFGERHANCKLTEPDIFEILWRGGCGESDSSIAEDFTISRRYVCDIRNRNERNKFTTHD